MMRFVFFTMLESLEFCIKDFAVICQEVFKYNITLGIRMTDKQENTMNEQIEKMLLTLQ